MVSQSHPPYRRGREGTFATAEEEAFFRAMSLRALEITAMLGAKWAVIHPVMDVTADINDVDAHVRYKPADVRPRGRAGRQVGRGSGL